MTDLKAKMTLVCRDVLAAYGLLTRLPVKVDFEVAQDRAAVSTWAYPLVGLGVGIIAGGCAVFGLFLGLSPALAACLALIIGAVVTGGLHEDGLADCADGLGGGYTVARRLEIMKDSHIGTFGVLALILFSIAKWSALNSLTPFGLLTIVTVAATLSRAPMPLIMALIPNARSGGLSARVGAPSILVAGIAGLVGLIVALVFVGWVAIPLLIVAYIAAFKIALVARQMIGGQTGDVLGAAQQFAEVGVLAVLVAVIA